ncbi:MAG TPA: hypothetical protein VED01_05305 [Burkholderiales bacterium]|nr:hypothetical protein [Burkholderiales bacterium]
MTEREVGLAILIATLLGGFGAYLWRFRYRLRRLTTGQGEPPGATARKPGGWFLIGAMILAIPVGSALYFGRSPWYAALIPAPSPENKYSTPDNLWLLLGYSVLVLSAVLKIRQGRTGTQSRPLLALQADDGPTFIVHYTRHEVGLSERAVRELYHLCSQFDASYSEFLSPNGFLAVFLASAEGADRAQRFGQTVADRIASGGAWADVRTARRQGRLAVMLDEYGHAVHPPRGIVINEAMADTAQALHNSREK